MSEEGVFLAAMFGIVLLIALLIGGAIFLESYECHAKWDQSGRSARWGMISGCMVQDGGYWVPAANVRVL